MANVKLAIRSKFYIVYKLNLPRTKDAAFCWHGLIEIQDDKYKFERYV